MSEIHHDEAAMSARPVLDGAFLRMQDAIENAIREAGHDLPDLADVAFVAAEAAIEQVHEDAELARRARAVRTWWTDWTSDRRDVVRSVSRFLAQALDDLDVSKPATGMVPPTMQDPS